MSRVIQTDGVGKERNRLLRGIVISIRELMKQSKPDSKTKDLAAFISIALLAVDLTIERTVAPWEKRNYWVKADTFRQEWSWVKPTGEQLRTAALDDNWPEVAGLAAAVGARLAKIKVSDRHRMGTPWVGAWNKLQQDKDD
ncbi:MAG: hypothetical protein ABFS17_14280 [Chloroflexota bacterium]